MAEAAFDDVRCPRAPDAERERRRAFLLRWRPPWTGSRHMQDLRESYRSKRIVPFVPGPRAGALRRLRLLSPDAIGPAPEVEQRPRVRWLRAISAGFWAEVGPAEQLRPEPPAPGRGPNRVSIDSASSVADAADAVQKRRPPQPRPRRRVLQHSSRHWALNRRHGGVAGDDPYPCEPCGPLYVPRVGETGSAGAAGSGMEEEEAARAEIGQAELAARTLLCGRLLAARYDAAHSAGPRNHDLLSLREEAERVKACGVVLETSPRASARARTQIRTWVAQAERGGPPVCMVGR
eukprot:TRINITY_DN7272_c0_g1_i1.p1 TRINITY_DN7272_c0_g1~~TRINITY_DN7272_c0_g1_i1.p1  ORF type:complete len:307 (+),score=103.82 TRINITY_DN7272_c0_g1_i1:46-921(+)